MRIQSPTLTAFACVVSASLAAQTPATQDKPAKPTTQEKTMAGHAGMSNADHKFVTDAAMGGMAEVELGNLASTKAESADVKSFAQRMVTDHGKANDELKQLAQTKNITLPTEIGPQHKAIRARLDKLSGAAFDRGYMREMVTAHTQNEAKFQRESKNGKDADIKKFATDKLPTIREHLAMAKDINGKMVGTSGKRPAKGK